MRWLARSIGYLASYRWGGFFLDKASSRSYIFGVGAGYSYKTSVSPKGEVALRILRARTLLTPAQIVEESCGEIPYGSIWRVLESLIRKGLIQWSWAPDSARYSGKRRRRYEITRDGSVASGQATPDEVVLSWVGGLVDPNKKERKGIKERVG